MPEQYKEIQKLSKLNLPASQMLLQLQTSNNETFATNQTITNALQKIQREDLAGRTPIKISRGTSSGVPNKPLSFSSLIAMQLYKTRWGKFSLTLKQTYVLGTSTRISLVIVNSTSPMAQPKMAGIHL
jgi:hypothetical protein